MLQRRRLGVGRGVLTLAEASWVLAEASWRWQRRLGAGRGGFGAGSGVLALAEASWRWQRRLGVGRGVLALAETSSCTFSRCRKARKSASSASWAAMLQRRMYLEIPSRQLESVPSLRTRMAEREGQPAGTSYWERPTVRPTSGTRILDAGRKPQEATRSSRKGRNFQICKAELKE